MTSNNRRTSTNPDKQFVQRTHSFDLLVDITCIGEILTLLDEDELENQ